MLRRYTFLPVAAALTLMVLPVFFPPVNGARIWIRFGGFSFQPAEFAKVLLAVFFAGHLAAGLAVLRDTGRKVWGCGCRRGGHWGRWWRCGC